MASILGSHTFDFDDILGGGRQSTNANVATSQAIHESDLARLLGISRQHVSERGRSGLFVKTGRATYDMQQAVSAYCAHLRDIASRPTTPAGDELKAEKLRLTAAQADAQELKNRQSSGDLVPIADVRREWVTAATDLRAQILAIPARVASRMGLSREAAVTLEEEIRIALEELRDER